VRLKLSDIDSSRDVIVVRDGKGNKERLTLLGFANFAIYYGLFNFTKPSLVTSLTVAGKSKRLSPVAEYVPAAP